MDQVGGLNLWLPRLGVTVLPHEPVTGGWVCTLIAADAAPPGWLPTGTFDVSDLELRTAIATGNPWLPTADLTVAEFGDAWQVRLAWRCPRIPTPTSAVATCSPPSSSPPPR